MTCFSEIQSVQDIIDYFPALLGSDCRLQMIMTASDVHIQGIVVQIGKSILHVFTPKLHRVESVKALRRVAAAHNAL